MGIPPSYITCDAGEVPKPGHQWINENKASWCLPHLASHLVFSSASASHSLWGKKVVFDGRTCVWQLEPEVAVPALEELSVCVLLNRSIGSVWTGFAYKAPGGTHIELGLEGDNTQLVAWLFGKEWLVTKGLTLYEWHSVCLTWSSQAQRLRLYINGTNQLDASVNSSLPRRLAQNGTLTLGVSHNVANGKLQIENGKTLFGEIGLFRIWAREWSAEELGTPSCADGDVVSWDVRQWNYSCTLQPDSTLQCARPAMWLIILLLHTYSKLSFSSEFYVSVSPAADVGVVQANITELLNLTFSYDFLNLTVDPNSLSIQPVGGELNSDTDATDWADPDMTACKPLVTISDLDKINVTAGNAAEVVDMIQDLIDVEFGSAAVGEGELSASQLDTVMEKLDAVVDISVVTRALGAEIINIIADILVSKSDITPVANSVLNLTERLGDNMEFQGESASLTAPSLGFSMINVDPDKFRGLTFGVSSLSSGLDPKIFVNQNFVSEPFPDTVATISLPSALHDFFPPGDRNRTRVQFQFYGVQDLFKDPDTTITTEGNWTLNTYIVSASINNSHVSNLKHQRVVVTLSHQNPKEQKDKVQCVFWDFQKNGGQGGWNGNGCETLSISANQTSCLCDHLTHFGVLLDVDRAPISEADSQILTVISYLGCGISSIFLGVTLLTYLAFEKLRRDYPSKILINLSVALLGLNMLFLLDSWLSSFPSYGLCIVTAATLHYFLLASFAWMGLEAVHMYFALVKVFNVYVPSYILKFCAVGWGIPLVIISLVLAIDKDAYGSALPQDAGVVLQDSQPFCWLQSDVFFYVTVVPFVLLVLLCNISVFIVVLIQIRQMRTNKPSANSHGSLHDLRAVASLTVLLGLTWPVAFFAWGPARVALLYMFTILNSLQGLFVFVFHCLMKENVRKQWRIHLCCGRFRLSDHSDWSRSVTVGGRVKQKQLVNSASNGSVDTSSIRKVSDSSTGSAPNHHQGE
ncbi:adhesion G protein-coupled receptor G4a [Centroberyx gerrardi]